MVVSVKNRSLLPTSHDTQTQKQKLKQELKKSKRNVMPCQSSCFMLLDSCTCPDCRTLVHACIFSLHTVVPSYVESQVFASTFGNRFDKNRWTLRCSRALTDFSKIVRKVFRVDIVRQLCRVASRCIRRIDHATRQDDQ